MKTIVVVKGKSEIGKTPAIIEVYKKLTTPRCNIVDGPEFHGKDNTDVEVELEYKGKRIGISSMGDPESDLYERLKYHAENDCKVILTASRTSKSTVEDILKIADRKKYDVIWTSHYYHHDAAAAMPNGLDLNKQFAPGLVELILSLL